MQSNVIPNIDFQMGKINLFGNRKSCRQCWVQISNSRRPVYEYSIDIRGTERKLHVCTMLQLDEAMAAKEKNVGRRNRDACVSACSWVSYRRYYPNATMKSFILIWFG